MRWPHLLLAPAALVVLAGCSLPDKRADYQSIDPEERSMAAIETGKSRNTRDIPRLIEMLDSADPALRMIAGKTLYDLTGETLGYRFSDPYPKRREAIDRWEEWWSEHQGGTISPASNDAGSGKP